MQLVSAYTTTATSDGELTDGSVASGVSPTILTAAFFNGMQRELVGAIEGAGLTLDGSNDAQLLAAIKALISSNHGSQEYVSSGSFIVPDDIYTVYLSGTGAGGGGGGGGGAFQTAACGSGGGGGGAGVFAIRTPVAVTPGQTIAVTIGASGSAGLKGTATTSTGGGGAGGSTKFGTLLTLAGGGAGDGGNSILSSSSSAAGAAGGSSGGGMGQDGSTSVGYPFGMGGQGASSPFGIPSSPGRSGAAAAIVGKAGLGYGAGGSGGSAAYNVGSGAAGFAGQPGFLLVEW